MAPAVPRRLDQDVAGIVRFGKGERLENSIHARQTAKLVSHR